MKLLLEQWKKYLTEGSDWRSEDYTDDMLAGNLASHLARQIAKEAGEDWSWLEDDLSDEGNDLKYVMEIGIQPEDSATLQALQDPRKYFKNNYADIEMMYMDRKEMAADEDEWVRNFRTTLEELSSWIETL